MPIMKNSIFRSKLSYVISDQVMNRWVNVIDRRMDTIIVFPLLGALPQASISNSFHITQDQAI